MAVKQTDRWKSIK